MGEIGKGTRYGACLIYAYETECMHFAHGGRGRGRGSSTSDRATRSVHPVFLRRSRTTRTPVDVTALFLLRGRGQPNYEVINLQEKIYRRKKLASHVPSPPLRFPLVYRQLTDGAPSGTSIHTRKTAARPTHKETKRRTLVTDLVGHGVEEGAEGRNDALPAGDVAVQPVREGRAREDRGAPDVPPGQGGVEDGRKDLSAARKGIERRVQRAPMRFNGVQQLINIEISDALRASVRDV